VEQHVHLHLYPPVPERGGAAGTPPPTDGGHGHDHPPGECCPECCPFADVPGHVHGGPMIPGDPEMLFSVFIDDVEHTIHRLPRGQFHTHQLPFRVFTSMEEAARSIVNQTELGVHHGPA
jgi:hypothetical protein